ncbi:MAG TPA: hypothetical protein ENJ10_01140 [Caldithrix abyssi]|uniref:Uncharacterized protein n=1 Tax=Caldithrix abyssi TaxID=187145 RepID=A0A7V1LX96_CALAY|nr:hypothetical protein [Caldithrix abyssi]
MKFRFLPWTEDKWKSRNGHLLKYDKLEHFIRDFILLLSAALLFGLNAPVLGGWLAFILLWEVRDGLRPYDGKNIEGFSVKDVLAGLMGGFVSIIVYAMISSGK